MNCSETTEFLGTTERQSVFMKFSNFAGAAIAHKKQQENPFLETGLSFYLCQCPISFGDTATLSSLPELASHVAW